MKTPLNVRLSFLARAKLEKIYEYSCERWGQAVARQYLDDLEAVIHQAAVDHGGTKRNPDYSSRFTYSRARQHLIFYDVIDDTLYVATVFHGMMDIESRLADEMAEIRREINKSTG